MTDPSPKIPPDLLGSFDSIFGDLFAAKQAPPSKDVSIALTVPLVEAAHGAERRLEVESRHACALCGGEGHPPGATKTACRSCAGSGRKVERREPVVVTNVCDACAGRGGTWDATCASCGGAGHTTERQALTVKIPPGVAEGSVLRLAGRGHDLGAGRGDVLVHVQVAPSPTLRREGDDLHARVAFAQASLGEPLRVPWLEGTAAVPVPAGAKAGDVLRLPGWGCVKLGSAYAPPPSVQGAPYRSAVPGRGDLVVTLVGDVELGVAYQTLGLAPGASRAAIDRAYRRLMQAYTPVTPETERRVAKIEAAYAELAHVRTEESAAPPATARGVAIVSAALAAAAALAYFFLH